MNNANSHSPKGSLFGDLKVDMLANIGECNLSSWLKALFHPGFQLCLIYRLAHQSNLSGFQAISRLLTAIGRIVTGSDIHYKAKLEPGIIFPHGRGIVIGEGVTIHSKCSIFHNTTLGSYEGKNGFPTLKEGVNLYPGTVVAGDICVGEYCRIGPNVYLTESVSSHTRISPAKGVFCSTN